jgi:Fe2+ transport system protein FeoA
VPLVQFSSALPRFARAPSLTGVNLKKSESDCDAPENCRNPALCPLNQVKAGTVVCVRELATSPEISDRLREMGLREDSRIRLVSHQDSVICQVCNARVALSQKLAEVILVEPV